VEPFIPKKRLNPDKGKFSRDYFLWIFFLSTSLAITGISLIQLKIVSASEKQLLIIYAILFVVFSFLAIVFNLVRQRLKGVEGFFFLFSIIAKLLLVAGFSLWLVKFKSLTDHSLLILFLVSYAIFVIYDLKYKVKLLKS
jgi:hypothetical protein